MTLKSWLREWLADDPPPPSPTSMTSTTTPSTSTADPLVQMTTLMMTMMRESQRETRELVLSILQGRPSTGAEPLVPSMSSPSTLEAPNYDDDSIPLPSGIEAVFSREEMEAEELRRLQTEQQRLRDQLRDTQLRLLTDPQGPGSMSSS